MTNSLPYKILYKKINGMIFSAPVIIAAGIPVTQEV